MSVREIFLFVIGKVIFWLYLFKPSWLFDKETLKTIFGLSVITCLLGVAFLFMPLPDNRYAFYLMIPMSDVIVFWLVKHFFFYSSIKKGNTTFWARKEELDQINSKAFAVIFGYSSFVPLIAVTMIAKFMSR
jgi:hypothetical protein